MKRRGKVVACSTLAVGLVVVIAAGVGARGRITEQWYLWKLEKGSDDEQVVAAAALGNIRSVRAVPILLTKLMGQVAAKRNTEYIGSHEGLLGERGHAFHKALVKIGKPVTLSLLKARRDYNDSWAAVCLAPTLLGIYPCPECSQLRGHRQRSCDELVLQQLRDDPSEAPAVRQTATEVLEKDYSHAQ